MENNENSDLFKNKYLKYKREYLVLKEQFSGNKNKTKRKTFLEKILPSYFVLYVVLDEATYNALVRRIKTHMLSILNIEQDLQGCGLKINEHSDEIQFINVPTETNKLQDHTRRKTGMQMPILSPEYKLKNEKKSYLPVIGNIETPYQFGMIYNDPIFITQLASIISTSLNKKPEKPVDLDVPYDIIPSTNNFFGVMLFKFTNSDCSKLKI
jgi:hypothetical protein